MAEEYDRESGNGGPFRQSRITVLEISLNVLREQVKNVRAALRSHIVTVDREDNEWREIIEEELKKIVGRLDAIDERHIREDVQVAWIVKEWRTVGGFITFGLAVFDALVHIKVF